MKNKLLKRGAKDVTRPARSAQEHGIASPSGMLPILNIEGLCTSDEPVWKGLVNLQEEVRVNS